MVQYTSKPHIQTVYKEKLYINDSKTNSEILTFSIFQVTPIFRSKNFHYIYAMEIICAYKCGLNVWMLLSYVTIARPIFVYLIPCTKVIWAKEVKGK